MPQLDRATYLEIYNLLEPLMKSADERATHFNRAFAGYKQPDIDVRNGTPNVALERMIKGLANHEPINGKQALWVLMEYLIYSGYIRDDIKEQVKALAPKINPRPHAIDVQPGSEQANNFTGYNPRVNTSYNDSTQKGVITTPQPSQTKKSETSTEWTSYGIVSLLFTIVGIVVAIIAIPDEQWIKVGIVVGMVEPTLTPTITPSPTPTHTPTPIPTYTPIPTATSSPIPTEVAQSLMSSLGYQPYERGFMIWYGVEGNGSVYVFYRVGEQIWEKYNQETLEALAPNPLVTTPVPGAFVMPTSGFGRVWGNYPQVHDRLGWATGSEIAYNAMIMTRSGLVIGFTLPDGQRVNMQDNYTWNH